MAQSVSLASHLARVVRSKQACYSRVQKSYVTLAQRQLCHLFNPASCGQLKLAVKAPVLMIRMQRSLLNASCTEVMCSSYVRETHFNVPTRRHGHSLVRLLKSVSERPNDASETRLVV
jgi:hypothetical protein